MKLAQQLATPILSTAQPLSQQRKPLQEQWTVNGDVFSSTAQLVSKGDQFEGAQAVYQFRTKPNGGQFTPQEKIHNAVGVACQGAVAGGVAGGIGSAFIAAATGLGDVINVLGGGHSRGVSGLVLAAPVLVGVLVGAGVGAHKGYQAEAPEMDGRIDGVLKNSGGELHFYPQGHVNRDVNLSQFQHAPEASEVQKTEPSSGVVGNTLMGAAAAAGTVPALLIPIVGLAGGAYVGASAGEALGDRTALGPGLGLAAGVASTVVAIAAVNLYGAKSLAYVAAGLGVVGGALGHAVFTGMHNQKNFDFGDQWWNGKSAPT